MKTGLREKLSDWIKSENGRVVTIGVIEQQVKLWGYKISNYERRLRPSESPNIERVFKHGAIIGYRWEVYMSPAVKDFLEKFPSKPKEPVKEPTGTLF